MINAITPDKLYLILPMKVSQLAVLYAHKFGKTVKEALTEIYSSNTYEELEREESKLWHLGPIALLEYISENK